MNKPETHLARTLKNGTLNPTFIAGDALSVLKGLPSGIIDCVVTSPPYWGHRQYANEGIGQEQRPNDYLDALLAITLEIQRVLKDSGSLWLNLGDSYRNKCLAGIPWRTAISMTDTQSWVLRNSVIWNKVKGGPDNAKDKLRNVHENLFHFTKSKKYFYDVDAIRNTAQKAKVVNGSVVSATGVSGVRYKRQIELSAALTEAEKANAFSALDNILSAVKKGDLSDFRMVIRGQQRTTHSDSTRVSGRAKELHDKGFYFLKYNPKGSKPKDVWDIIPEDRRSKSGHFAPFPEDLCKIPILATCPTEGIVLDPFCGTGTTNLVAKKLGRRSIGIDLSEEYIDFARERCEILV